MQRPHIRTKLVLLIAMVAAVTAHAGEVAPLADSIEAPVERVATLEFLQTEVALALGVVPAATTDPAGYQQYVGIEAEKLATARDLGTRQEPDLEGLVALAPDVIIGSWWRNETIADQLQAIAPTLLYNGLPAPEESNQYRRMRAIVENMGKRLRRGDAAARVLERLDARLARVADELRAADLDGTAVVLAQSVPGTTRFRLFTAHSLAARIADAVGLRNAWTSDGNAYGFQTVGLKELVEIDEAHLLWVTDATAPAIKELRGSKLWQALPVVSAGRVHTLARDTWFFGGPLSAARLAQRYAAALGAAPVNSTQFEAHPNIGVR